MNNDDDFEWKEGEESNPSTADFSTPKLEPSNIKVNNANVWHELGHVFAHCLTTQLGYDLGKITLVKLESGDSRMCTDKKIYFNLNPNYFKKGRDCYGEVNKEFYSDTPEEIIASFENVILEDKSRTLGYIIGLISGGLFNIFGVVQDFNDDILDKCYSHSKDVNLVSDYKGCGESDWDKIKRITCALNWEYSTLKSFREEVSKIYLKNKVYNKIDPIINGIKPCVNKIEGNALEGIVIRIDKIIDEIPELKSDIQSLIEEYSKKDIITS